MARVVYRTDHGRVCPKCGLAVAQCSCRAASSTPGDGRVRVRRETKGRKGKAVTVVTGVPLGGDELTELGAQLKKRCGAGGTVKDGVIEIQGDHRDTVVGELRKHGWDVKAAGG